MFIGLVIKSPKLTLVTSLHMHFKPKPCQESDNLQVEVMAYTQAIGENASCPIFRNGSLVVRAGR